MHGRLTVTAGRREHAVVYAIQKYGGASVPASTVTRCAAMAVERAAGACVYTYIHIYV